MAIAACRGCSSSRRSSPPGASGRRAPSARAGERDAGRASAPQALELVGRTDDGPGLAATVMQLGWLAADAGRTRQARELQERALMLWGDFAGNTGWRPPLLVELAEL